RESARRGHWELAERLYRDIVERHPDQVDALEGLGLLALRARRGGEARGWLGRARALAPASARVVGHLAPGLRQSGPLARALARALACHEEACRLAPGDAAALVNRARTERDAGRLADAIESFRRALALRPRSADVWSMLSNALREAGQADPALQAARRALALEP